MIKLCYQSIECQAFDHLYFVLIPVFSKILLMIMCYKLSPLENNVLFVLPFTFFHFTLRVCVSKCCKCTTSTFSRLKHGHWFKWTRPTEQIRCRYSVTERAVDIKKMWQDVKWVQIKIFCQVFSIKLSFAITVILECSQWFPGCCCVVLSS